MVKTGRKIDIRKKVRNCFRDITSIQQSKKNPVNSTTNSREALDSLIQWWNECACSNVRRFSNPWLIVFNLGERKWRSSPPVCAQNLWLNMGLNIDWDFAGGRVRSDNRHNHRKQYEVHAFVRVLVFKAQFHPCCNGNFLLKNISC